MKKLTRNKRFLLIVSAMLFVIIFTACGKESDSESKGQEKSDQENPIVTITMENDKEIKIELYPDKAPNTVNNFISLVKEGFYDGLIFHRVIPEFMIQGGDPKGNGTGGPGYSIKGEFSSNGFENDLKHERGVISMARSSDPDSAGSQFFIMVKASPNLDGKYAAFGKVVEGMEVVDAIVSVERNAADKPIEEQRMKNVKVETNGYDYSEPDVIE
ncbi:peptidylprolyl isomerase [Virgibacillus necropolis]|uniref:peptidylprolyl isomerase n=1 Tax=Virgibacillus necropolis TaxID=163877 RepID=UPI00384D8FE0